MLKVKLFCAVGMSTSMLVNKMREAAKEKGLETDISAHSISEFEEQTKDVDVILLGPQVSYLLDKFKEQANGKPIDVIPMMDYGMMNGKNVVEFALKLKEEIV